MSTPEPYDFPYWRRGEPVTTAMVPTNMDLCDGCGHARDRHRLSPLLLGIPCIHPKCGCQRSNGYRRVVGPVIIETITGNGKTWPINQPAPPGQPIPFVA